MPQTIETAVILAAGRGTRLQPYTHDIPKGCMKVGEEKLIERSVRILKENGIRNIIIGTGHLHEQYEDFAQKNELTTFLNPEFATTGSFHTLQCGENKLLSNGFLLLESDLLYHSEAISRLLKDPRDNIILCSGFTLSNDEVYVEIKNEQLNNLSKNREELKSVDGELVGIWKISQKFFKKLMKHYSDNSESNSIDYEMAIAKCADTKVGVLKIEDLVWCEIDNEEHLKRAKTEVLPKLRK